MNRRLKLYSGLNVAGWLVVMPVLMVVLLSPVVNFHEWPGAAGLERGTAQVALLPPRLTEHGSSLARLSERPEPAARVPVHATVATTFQPARSTARESSSRRVHAASPRRTGRPAAAGRGPVRRAQTAGRSGTSVPAARRSAPAPLPPIQAHKPTPPAKAPPAANPGTGKPGKPHNGQGAKPDDPQHGQAGKPGPPPQSQSQPAARSDDPQHGQAGKREDPQHGQGAGKGDDPEHGEKGKDKGRD